MTWPRVSQALTRLCPTCPVDASFPRVIKRDAQKSSTKLGPAGCRMCYLQKGRVADEDDGPIIASFLRLVVSPHPSSMRYCSLADWDPNSTAWAPSKYHADSNLTRLLTHTTCLPVFKMATTTTVEMSAGEDHVSHPPLSW